MPSGFDHFVREVVDGFDGSPELSFVADVEEFQGLPDGCGGDEAEQCGFGCILEGRGEGDCWEAGAETAGVDAEGDHADVVEG